MGDRMVSSHLFTFCGWQIAAANSPIFPLSPPPLRHDSVCLCIRSLHLLNECLPGRNRGRMASPPRRMTRARAKKEGVEPDGRINPDWKTPRKSKTGKQHLLQHDTLAVEPSTFNLSFPPLDVQRPPSPVKIRIAAKLPPIPPPPPMQSSSSATLESTSTAIPESPRKQTNLGSPVRVRPRAEVKFRNVADKENSPAATILKSWTASGKSSQSVRHPTAAARNKPLEPSPASTNANVQPTAVKVLSSPVRIFIPQTPARSIGTARRIPLKFDKAHAPGGPSSKVLRDASREAFQRPLSPSRPASPVRKLTAPYKPSFSSPEKAVKAFTSDIGHSDSPMKQSTKWTPLPSIAPLPRPSVAPKKPMASSPPRPKKLPTVTKPSPPPRPSSKLDFYVDESLSAPLHTQPKSVQRTSSSIPRFPIRPRPHGQSPTSPEPAPSPQVVTKPIKLGSLHEFKPVIKADKWKTPIKQQPKSQAQATRKVGFRTPSMDSPVTNKEALTLQRSGSILTLGPPKRYSTPDLSTTPVSTPQSPSSPKVFDLSSADASFELFPRQPKIGDELTSFRLDPIALPVPQPLLHPEITPEPVTEPTVIRPVPAIRSQVPPKVAKSLTIPKRNARPSSGSRDISVPIKDPDDLPSNPVTPKVAATPTRRASGGKESTGPLHGVVAFVDVKTADGDAASAPFAESLRNLGARVVKQWGWNGEDVDKVGITHVIYKEGGARTLAKVKCAKGAVKCVGLGWISRFAPSNSPTNCSCEAEKVKVDETPFLVETGNGKYTHRVCTFGFWFNVLEEKVHGAQGACFQWE
jgi:hypothetical protein